MEFLIDGSTVTFNYEHFIFTDEEVKNIHEQRKSFQVSDLICVTGKNEIYEINGIYTNKEDRRKGYASRVLQDFCSGKNNTLIIAGAGAHTSEYNEEPTREEYIKLFEVLDKFYTKNKFEDVTQLFGTYDGTTKRTYLYKNRAGKKAIKERKKELKEFNR